MAEWKNTGSGSLASLVRDTSTLSDAREAFQGLVETIWRLRQPTGAHGIESRRMPALPRT